MRIVGGFLVLLVACADGGLIIEVDPVDPAVDHIRLFVGVGDPTMPDRFGPADVQPIDGVTYWHRDALNELDEIAVEDDKPVRFRFKPGATSELPVVIAIGFSNGQPIATASAFDIHGGADAVNLYRLALSAPVSSFDDAAPNALALWSEPAIIDPYQATCVGVTTERGPAFIVKPGDQDCDGRSLDRPSDLECNPDEYMSARPPSRDELSCVKAVTSPAASCRLGGPACVDGMARDATSCSPAPYCAPSALCAACTTLDCLANPTNIAGWAAMAIHCTVHTESSGSGLQLCADRQLVPRLPTGSAMCTDAAIRDATKPFADQLDIGGATFKLTYDAGCNLSFTPGGSVPGPTTFGGLIALDLETGAGLAAPIVFDVVSDGCTGAPASCTLDLADSGWQACGASTGRCGTAGAIRDDFEDPVMSPQWNLVGTSGTVGETGGALVILNHVLSNVGYSAKHTVSLRGSAVEVELKPSDAFLSSGAVAMLRLVAEPPGGTGVKNAIVMTVRGSALTAVAYQNGTANAVATGSFDKALTSHWRIAEMNGYVQFFTSPDGATWQLFGSFVGPPFIDNVRIELFAGDGSLSTGPVAFDNLNVNVPRATWCPATTFSDPFQRTEIGPDWLATSPAGGGSTTTCQLVVNNGAMIKSYGANTNCFFGTSTGYDLTGSSAEIQIEPVDPDPALQVALEAVTDTGEVAAIRYNGASLCGVPTTGNATCVADMNGMYTRWRMRESAGTLFFEVSADGMQWMSLGSASTNTMSVKAVELRLRAYTSSSPTPSLTVIFNRYN